MEDALSVERGQHNGVNKDMIEIESFELVCRLERKEITTATLWQ